MTWRAWLLGVILLCGAILRFYGLDFDSLWADEGITVHTVSSSFAAMKAILAKSIHPPLYYLLLHPVTQAFGNSEWVARLPSAIFGVVSIFMTYRLGKLLFNTDTGLLAAGLVALSYFQIRYSQEARNYALMTMLALYAYYYFTQLLRQPSRKASAGYVIASVLLLYTHVYGIFAILSHNLYMLIRACALGKKVRPSLSHWIGLQGLTALLFTPWVSVLMHHLMSRQKAGSWHSTPSTYTLSATFGVYAGSLPLLILFVGIVVLAIALWWIKRRDVEPSWETNLKFSRMEPVYIVLTWLASYTLAPFMLSQAITSLYHYRYTIVGSIAFYLLIALALRQLQRARLLLPVALVGIAALSGAALQDFYTKPHKERWRDAAAYLDAHARPEDLLLFTSGFLLDTNFNYYSKRDDLNKQQFPTLDNLIRLRMKRPYNYQENMRQISQSHDRIWLVLSHASLFKQSMIDILSDSHTLKDHQKYHSFSHMRKKAYLGIEVMYFEKQRREAFHSAMQFAPQT